MDMDLFLKLCDVVDCIGTELFSRIDVSGEERNNYNDLMKDLSNSITNYKETENE